jgi:hypothetical protein
MMNQNLSNNANITFEFDIQSTDKITQINFLIVNKNVSMINKTFTLQALQAINYIRMADESIQLNAASTARITFSYIGKMGYVISGSTKVNS